MQFARNKDGFVENKDDTYYKFLLERRQNIKKERELINIKNDLEMIKSLLLQRQ